MIPKKIHYCWFGRGPKSELAKKCIESWKKFLPDYEVKEWNEDNFDLNLYPYAKEALENRKFAFVTDVVRLYALYTEGGVYMDTDVEVLKSYDPFLSHTAFSGFENNNYVPTGMMASEKGGVWVKELLDQYNDRRFVNPDGTFDITTNTVVITNYMVDKGLKLNNTFQDIPGLCTMYPSEYFCPKDHTTGQVRCTDNSVCIHHFAGSWRKHTFWGDLKHSLKTKMISIFGQSLILPLTNILTGRMFKKNRT